MAHERFYHEEHTMTIHGAEQGDLPLGSLLIQAVLETLVSVFDDKTPLEEMPEPKVKQTVTAMVGICKLS